MEPLPLEHPSPEGGEGDVGAQVMQEVCEISDGEHRPSFPPSPPSAVAGAPPGEDNLQSLKP